jgi:hypothetical protein
MKTPVKIALIVVFFVVVGGILAAIYMYNMKHTNTAKAKPDYVVTSADLQKEFEDNETTASAKYINKIVEVTGTVASVKQAENNSVNITLITGSDMSSVICTFTKLADYSKLKAGDKVTIRGECSGYLMDVLLNNCSLIKLNVPQ